MVTFLGSIPHASSRASPTTNRNSFILPKSKSQEKQFKLRQRRWQQTCGAAPRHPLPNVKFIEAKCSALFVVSIKCTKNHRFGIDAPDALLAFRFNEQLAVRCCILKLSIMPVATRQTFLTNRSSYTTEFQMRNASHCFDFGESVRIFPFDSATVASGLAWLVRCLLS